MHFIHLNSESPPIYFTYDFHESFQKDKQLNGPVDLINNLGEMLNYDKTLSLNIFETAGEISRLNSIISSDRIIRISPEIKKPDFATLLDAEIIIANLNDPSTGRSFSPEFIEDLHNKYPDKKLLLDTTTTFPLIPIDFEIVDGIYFVQNQCFGSPGEAGYLLNKSTLTKFISKSEVLSDTTREKIVLFNSILEDFNNKGIEQIRRETKYKAAVIHHAIDSNPNLFHHIPDPDDRSDTTIGFESKQDIQHYLKNHGYLVGKCNSDTQGTIFTIVNYPTHSKEQFEKLSDLLISFRPDYSFQL